jgi:hypothetical protein
MPIALIPVRLPGKQMKNILIAFLTVIFFSASAPAFADYEDDRVESIDVVVDVAFVRPLGLVSIAVGVTLFIISLPFTVVSGDTDKAARVLLAEPIDYTFKRPLGEFDERRYGRYNHKSD